jgi:hypothetical protein
MRTKSRTSSSAAAKKHRGLSRLRKPENMSLEDWQVALRRDFGRAQRFRLKNLGDEPIFSEFEVANPETKRTYRVAIRGAALGENFCSCPDYAVNTLGTCKQVRAFNILPRHYTAKPVKVKPRLFPSRFLPIASYRRKGA